MEKEKFNKLGYHFCNEMIALAHDFFEIATQKIDSIIKKTDSLKKNNDGSELVNYHELKNLSDDNLKHHLFRIAMFNYMNSIFERGVNDLLKLSIREDDDVKARFIEKFIDYDHHRIKNGQTSIRNTKFELMSQGDRDLVYLKFFKEVCEFMPPPLNWKFFYDISDQRMWRDKNLRFDFNEIKSRRNLLTHRGTHFDEEYAERVIYGATKSKNFIDPQERIEFFFKRKLFTHHPKITKENNNLYTLINQENPIPVIINNSYFNHSFSVLMNLYFKLWNHATKSDHLLVQTSHDLLVSSRKLSNPSYVFLVLDLLNEFYKDFDGQFSSDYLKANHLLAFREMRFIVNKFTDKTLRRNKLEQEFLDYFKISKEPIYKVLVSVVENDLDGAISNLLLCRGLPKSGKNWFLFTDIFENPRFEDAFQIATSPLKGARKK